MSLIALLIKPVNFAIPLMTGIQTFWLILIISFVLKKNTSCEVSRIAMPFFKDEHAHTLVVQFAAEIVGALSALGTFTQNNASLLAAGADPCFEALEWDDTL